MTPPSSPSRFHPVTDVRYLSPEILTEIGACIADTTRSSLTETSPTPRRVAFGRQPAPSFTAARASFPIEALLGELGPDGRWHPHHISHAEAPVVSHPLEFLAVVIRALLSARLTDPVPAIDVICGYHQTRHIPAADIDAIWPLIYASGSPSHPGRRSETAASALTALELTELTRAALRSHPDATDADATPTGIEPPLRSLFPDLTGTVSVLDVGVESSLLHRGRWLTREAEHVLVHDALAAGAAAAVFPCGQYRLTRTAIDTSAPSPVWATDTEIWFPLEARSSVVSPVDAVVMDVGPHSVTLRFASPATEVALDLTIDGIHVRAAVSAFVSAGTVIGDLPAPAAQAEDLRAVAVRLRRADAPTEKTACGRALLVTPDRVPAWNVFAPDSGPLLGLPARPALEEPEGELVRREQVFAKAQERYFARPMQVQRGWRHHLIDTTGRSYVDMVNNVASIGHGHPGVADAIAAQAHLLNTNSRFLYRELAEYSERLLALLPAGTPLDTVLLVNSGSEAVDLSIRLAQAVTGRDTIIALREAYHGWTVASDAVSTSAFDNPDAIATRPHWVHIADVPNTYRGTHRGPNAGQRYLHDFARDLQYLVDTKRPPAAFICESVLGNAGGVLLPEGYLADAYSKVRALGGVCIADEIQVGFGRLGSSFWGFTRENAIPDIITIAKPMGNGLPLGAVITSQAIADALSQQGHFFSSAGGNPLSCQAGIAVLDALRDEHLQHNASRVGAHLRTRLLELAARHPLIGTVHGEGLYLGVELVKDPDTLEPAALEARAICERMRELGVIMTTTSERSNVLKMKPPLTLTERSADHVIDALDRVLAEGW